MKTRGMVDKLIMLAVAVIVDLLVLIPLVQQATSSVNQWNNLSCPWPQGYTVNASNTSQHFACNSTGTNVALAAILAILPTMAGLIGLIIVAYSMGVV